MDVSASEKDFSLLSGSFGSRNGAEQTSGQIRTNGETPAGIASTCCRVPLLACLVGPALLAPAVAVLLPVAALAVRLPALELLAVLCTVAVLVAFDEVDFA